jgi:thioredoxin-related protein
MPVKKILSILLFIAFSCTAFSQVDTAQPPFKRFPTHPPLQMLLSDSVTKYTKNDLPKKTPVLFMLFSPDCSHCQHTAEEMIKYKDDIKDFQIVMTSLHPLWQMNAFIEKYRLKDLENVVIGKGLFNIMPSFYNIKNMPFQAFYNKKGNLITTFEGSMPLLKIIEVFKQNK